MAFQEGNIQLDINEQSKENFSGTEKRLLKKINKKLNKNKNTFNGKEATDKNSDNKIDDNERLLNMVKNFDDKQRQVFTQMKNKLRTKTDTGGAFNIKNGNETLKNYNKNKINTFINNKFKGDDVTKLEGIKKEINSLNSAETTKKEQYINSINKFNGTTITIDEYKNMLKDKQNTLNKKIEDAEIKQENERQEKISKVLSNEDLIKSIAGEEDFGEAINLLSSQNDELYKEVTNRMKEKNINNPFKNAEEMKTMCKKLSEEYNKKMEEIEKLTEEEIKQGGKTKFKEIENGKGKVGPSPSEITPIPDGITKVISENPIIQKKIDEEIKKKQNTILKHEEEINNLSSSILNINFSSKLKLIGLVASDLQGVLSKIKVTKENYDRVKAIKEGLEKGENRKAQEAIYNTTEDKDPRHIDGKLGGGTYNKLRNEFGVDANPRKKRFQDEYKKQEKAAERYNTQEQKKMMKEMFDKINNEPLIPGVKIWDNQNFSYTSGDGNYTPGYIKNSFYYDLGYAKIDGEIVQMGKDWKDGKIGYKVYDNVSNKRKNISYLDGNLLPKIKAFEKSVGNPNLKLKDYNLNEDITAVRDATAVNYQNFLYK